MKEDNLEKFVRENRASFDDLEPSMEIWGKINAPRPRKLNWYKVSVSAAAAILLFAGIFYVYNQQQNTQNHIAKLPKEIKEVIQKEQPKDSVVTIQPEEKQIADVVVRKKKSNIVKKEVVQEPLNNEMNELAEATQYYSNQIENKKEEILNCVAYDPEIDKEIMNEFTPLDAAFNELKKDLNDNANNTQIMEAMIQNYRTRLDILSDIKNQICSRE